MRLISIPSEKYDEYKLDVIFNGYKWDLQFGDRNTVAKHVLIIENSEFIQLKKLTEQLASETISAERAMLNNIKLAKPLALSKQMTKALKNIKNYLSDNHVRLMRFDFHPLENSAWAISEVNSDVPGGFAESSVLPQIAKKTLVENHDFVDFSQILIDSIISKVPKKATIAFVHCTSYSDDRQVMQFLGDRLITLGYRILYAAVNHFSFKDNRAVCNLFGNECEVDFIFRFTPLEWMIDGKRKKWQEFFNILTPSCNHPMAILAQTKNLPLAFDNLEREGINLSCWRALLPETISAKQAIKNKKDGFIFKPVFGRVGEGIGIKEACGMAEYSKIIKDAKKYSKDYIAQKMFNSPPITSPEGEKFFVCIGAYSVDNKFAGFYARINTAPRIDSNSADIAVLVEGGGIE